jgi:hypothetical protein
LSGLIGVNFGEVIRRPGSATPQNPYRKMSFAA